jgi:hypothetical protein
MAPKLVTDEYEIKAVVRGQDESLCFYDDGAGALYELQEAFQFWLPTTALIRADSWEAAYEVYEDEFAPASDPDDIPTVKWSEESPEWAAFDETNRSRPKGGSFYYSDAEMRLDGAHSPDLSVMVSH